MIGPLIAALLASASPQAIAHRDLAMLPFSTMMFPLAQPTGVDYITGENIAGATFATASQDAVTVSGATLRPNTDYLLIASAELSVTATILNPKITLLNGATVLCDQSPQFKIAGSTDAPTVLSYLRKVTTSATPATDSWILRIGGDGVNNVTYANARLVLIKLGPNDAYAESHARQTWSSATSGTSQTAVSLNITPASPGRYLILGYLLGDVSANTHVVQLTGGGGDTGEHPIYTVGSSEHIPEALMLDVTLPASAQTFNLKVRCDGVASTLGAADACIVAIRLDRFANVYGSARSSASDWTHTGYATSPAWLTFTPNAADHLLLGIAHYRNTAANQGTVRVNDNGTTLVAPNVRPNYNNYNDTLFVGRIVNYAASQRNVKIEHKTTTAGQTVVTDCPSLIILDLSGGAVTPSSAVTVRDHAIASSSGSTLTLTLPASAVAGDCLFAFTGHGWSVSTGPGEFCEERAGTNWNGAYFVKELDAADITAGNVTFTYAGSFNGVRAGIVFQGMPRQIIAFESTRNSAGAASRAITTDASPRAGDYFIGFGSGRAASNVTCNVGAALRTVNAASASGALYGGSLAADGAFTTTFSYSTVPTGDFQVVVVVRA